RPTIWLSFLQDVAVAGVMIAIAMWMAGAENRKSVCRLLRLPRLNFLLIGLVLPLIVTLTPAIVRFVLDRVHWAAQDFGRFMPPHFQEYLPIPELWTVGLIFAAFGEELIFRGVLQKQFVSHYGAWRGIFLVGIVWACFHF